MKTEKKKTPTQNESLPTSRKTFHEAFPELAEAMAKVHENFTKVLTGEISIEEATAINKEAKKALHAAHQQIRLMRTTATLKRNPKPRKEPK